MVTSHAYFVRHGAMHHVGRFAADDGSVYRRGDVVVVRSVRGDEIGEVLAETAPTPGSPPRLLRVVNAEDLERSRFVAQDRARRLLACERVFRDGEWPLELIDVEPMLNDQQTVLLYLGPHRLDSSGLVQALRDLCDLDAVLEPVGLDSADDVEVEPEDHGCGSCGTGGGCGTSSGDGCGTSSGGCGSCSVKDLVTSRKTVAAH